MTEKSRAGKWEGVRPARRKNRDARKPGPPGASGRASLSLQDVDTEVELVAQRWVALVQRFDRTCPGLESRLRHRVDCLLRREPEASKVICSGRADAESDYWLG